MRCLVWICIALAWQPVAADEALDAAMKEIHSLVRQKAVTPRSLKTAFDEVENAPEILPWLDRIWNEATFMDPYNRDPNAKDQIYKVIKGKISSVLKEAFKGQRLALQALQSPLDVNRFREAFELKYEEERHFPITKAFMDEIKQKKTALVALMTPRIAPKLADMKVNEVYGIENALMSHVDESDPLVGTLRKAFNLYNDKLVDANRFDTKAYNSRKAAREGRIEAVKASLKGRAKTLRDTYQVSFPSFVSLLEMMDLARGLHRETKKEDIDYFLRRARRLGFTLNNSSGKLTLNINGFSNDRGHLLSTYKTQKDNRQINGAVLTIAKAPQDVVGYYYEQLTSEFRPFDQFYIQPRSLKSYVTDFKTAPHVRSGSTFYSMEMEGGTLKLMAIDRLDSSSSVASRVGFDHLEVTAWTSKTDVYVKRGETLNFLVEGKVKHARGLIKINAEGLDWAGAYDKCCNYSALIGKIGNGEWFTIGTGKRLKAKNSGRLQLRINDANVRDNEGEFQVYYILSEG